jgi:hypothetical protein
VTKAKTAGTIIDLTPGDARPPEPPPAAGAADPHGPTRRPEDAVEVVEADWPPVSEERVADGLRIFGGAANAGHKLLVPGDGYGAAELWRFTDDELAELAPPLTRIINRRARLRRLANLGDWDAIAVAVGFGRYGWRNFEELTLAREVWLADQEAERLSARHPEEEAPG